MFDSIGDSLKTPKGSTAPKNSMSAAKPKEAREEQIEINKNKVLENVDGEKSGALAQLNSEIIVNPEILNVASQKDFSDQDAVDQFSSNKRIYSLEGEGFVLKIYNKQGRLVNKIPPGYITLVDTGAVDVTV